MIVYGELLFIENMIIGWVLLYLTGEICGRRVGGGGDSGRVRRFSAYKWSLLAGSIMCGAFSMVIFLDAKAHLMMVMEVAFAFAVCIATFGSARIPWRHAVTFILVTYLMGGMTMGLLLVTQNHGIYTAAGIYTGDMKAAALALFIALAYMTIRQIIKTVKNKKSYTEHTFDVTIRCGEKNIFAKGFLDTGNHLTEPISGKPVAVASEGLWIRMQSCGLAPEKGIEAMQDGDGKARAGMAMIPYETVGAKGLLEAVKADMIIEDKHSGNRKRLKGCYIAGGDGRFKMGMSAQKEKGGAEWELLLSMKMIDTDVF